LLEDKHYQQRQKAEILLKLAQCVDDSNQRIRKSAVQAGKATVKDLIKLRDSVEEQLHQTLIKSTSTKQQPQQPEDAPILNNSNPNQAMPSTSSNQEPNLLVAQTMQNVMKATLQLREHAQLQYQMLEHKYFDIKRHAFDVEHQNRKLQLQLMTTPTIKIHNKTTNNTEQQLLYKNENLRKQLREACTDCRKLAEENYALRKILLDSGLHVSVSLTTETETEAASPQGSNEGEDDDNDDDENDDFVDTRMFQRNHSHGIRSTVMEPVTEETDTDLLMEENGFTITAKEGDVRRPHQQSKNEIDTKYFGSRTKQRSKAITLAAMANKMMLVEHSTEEKEGDTKSVTTKASKRVESDDTTATTNQRSDSETSSHDQNLALLGISGVSRNAQPSQTTNVLVISQSNVIGSNQVDQAVSKEEVNSKTVRTKQRQQRRRSHGDILQQTFGRLRSSSNSSTRSSRSSPLKRTTPTRQAMSAKDLKKKKKRNDSSNNDNGTFHIQMSRLAPPKSVTQKIRVSRELDPLEEEKRLSALLGGCRSGHARESAASYTPVLGSSNGATTTKAKAATTVTVAAIVTASPLTHPQSKRHPDYYVEDDDDMSETFTQNKGFFHRRRQSQRRRSSKKYSVDDDDNYSISSVRSMGSFLSFRNKNKSMKKAITTESK